MDHTSSSRGHNTFVHPKSEPSTIDISLPSTSVAAAAPEPTTLAVKLSEDPEGQALPGGHEVDDNKGRPYRDESRPSLKDEELNGRENSPAIRRSRSGRLLRSTAQYGERRSRSSSPENLVESHSSYARRTRSSYHNQSGHQDNDDQHDMSVQDGRGRLSENSDVDNNTVGRQERSRHQNRYGNENQDELASDEDQEDDGYPDEGDDANNEGSESMDTNSSKNDDGAESLVVSMYGSPSLVKVRSMFIDKLYKMVEDPSIQHLISWAKEGDMFYVYNCIELSSAVLPKFFKHNNWQSFVRQLNMYGFHKIYRYDREESTMNRRNPETQRWQFYHPDFQRDRPHLRNNIKRKSARSVNVAPAFSRVVFERDKSYYVQESAARPFGNQLGHGRTHSSNHLQDPHRLGPVHGGPPPGPMGHHYSPHPSSNHRSPHDSTRPSVPRPDYRPQSGHHPNDMVHRDEKDPASKQHMPPSHQSIPRGEQEPSHHHHQHYPGSSYHPQQQQQQHPYQSPHQRQHSYAGPPSQAHHSPEHGYSHKAQGFNSPHPPPQELHHSGPAPAHPMGPGRSSTQSHGHGASREPAYPEHGQDTKHGVAMSGGHFRSQSAPGLDPRRGDAPRGPHPFSQQEPPRSPPHGGPQPYYSREGYPSQPPPSHRHQGSFDEASDPSRRFTPPPPPAQVGAGVSHPNQQPSLDPSVGAEPNSTSPGMDTASNPNPHDLVPRTVKQLESRLHFVEDAYMSLRQFSQELQSIQASQDQTIAWMRDRIEQLSDAGTSRDVITSPALGQAGVVPSKRKAEYSPSESRDREWVRRAPGEHQTQAHQSYSRQGGIAPMGPSPLLQHQQAHPNSSGQGGPNSGPGGRYESPGFHQPYHSVHHGLSPSLHHPQPSQTQGTPQAPSQPPPPPPPSSSQPLSQPQPQSQHQHQHQHQRQRQHPSPPMIHNNQYQQKGSISSMIHD